MTDASLGLIVDSSQVAKGWEALDKLVGSSKKAETAARSLAGAEANVGKGVAESTRAIDAHSTSLGKNAVAHSMVQSAIHRTVDSLASGLPVTTILVQQGSEIAAAFGTGAGVAGVFSALISPTTLMIAGVTAAAGVMHMLSGAAKEAKDPLEAHKDLIDALSKAYDDAQQKGEDFNKAISKTRIIDLLGNSQDLQAKVNDAMKAIQGQAINLAPIAGTPDAEVDPVFKAFQDLIKSGDTQNFMNQIDRLGAADPTIVKSLQSFKDLAQAYQDAQDALKKNQAGIAALNSTMTAGDKATLALKDSQEKLATSARAGGNAVEMMQSRFELAEAQARTYSQAIGLAGVALDTLQANRAYAVLDTTTKATLALTTAIKDSRTELEKIHDAFIAAEHGATTYSQALGIAALAQKATGQAQDEQTKKATGETQIPGDFIDRLFGAESGHRGNAKNSKSSASGFGQFIDSTWLSLYKASHPAQVADGMSNASILALKSDLEVNKELTKEYAKQNALLLQRAGFAADDRNLYLAHFLGPGGAVKALQADPKASAAGVLGASAAKANPTVIGGGRSIQDVLNYAGRVIGAPGQLSQAQSITSFEKLVESADNYIERLRLQQTSLKTASEAELTLRHEQEMRTRATQAGIPLDDEQTRAIQAKAEQMAAADVATQRFRESQENLNATLDDVKDIAHGALSTFVDGLLQGKSAADALKDALAGVLSKMTDMLETALLDELFKKPSGGSGGGGGFLSGLIGSLFGGASGGGTGTVGLYASGTSYAPGGMAIVGEQGPELVNLPRGAQVIPNNALRPANSNGPGKAVNFTVINQAVGDGYESKQRSSSTDTLESHVVEIVKKATASGKMDTTMGARFGNSPQSVKR